MSPRSALIRSTRALVVFTFVAILGAGCASDSQVLPQANAFHGGIQPAVMEGTKDPELSNYLQTVGDRIIAAAREMDRQGQGPASHKKENNQWMFTNMKFHLVNSKTLNAFTTGGEHMYIYNQLFQECTTEDELTAVMAHEYAHVYCRHVHKGMDRQYMVMGGVMGATLLGQTVGGSEKGQTYAATAGGAATMLGQVWGMRYTRNDEAEADDWGFQFYVRGGWDPNRFGDFFQHMIDKGLDKGPEFLSDHPSLASRVQAAKQRASQLPPAAKDWRKPPIADATKFAALQARARDLGAKMPDDSSLQNSQELLAAMPRSCLTPAIQPDQKRAQQHLLTRAKAEQSK